MEGQLTKDQIENILSSQSFGRLACCDGDQPYIVPVNYAYDGEFIYGQTNAGRKLEIMRNNPNVCFETDLINNHRSWQSVIAEGAYEELDDEDADDAWKFLSGKVFSLLTGTRVHNHQHTVDIKLDDSSRIKVVMFRIRVLSISGRFHSE